MYAEVKKTVTPVSIYRVFVRNHTKEGTFHALYRELERIAAMGFDYICLTPVHPIGEIDRTGTMGSPYNVKDYYAIDKNLGTMDDFLMLVKRIHELGMKIMMDMAVHHTSIDHAWRHAFPTYYKGDTVNLDFSNTKMRTDLYHMFLYWADKGVDGFHCTAASTIPLDFWLEARRIVNDKYSDFLWLAENTETHVLKYLRETGETALSDSDTALAFDLLYMNDMKTEYTDAMKNQNLTAFERKLDFVLNEYPCHVQKTYTFENHDCERIAKLLEKKPRRIQNWIAFSFLTYGSAFVYAGEEAMLTRTPDLFEKDPLDHSRRDTSLEQMIRVCNAIRKKILPHVAVVDILENENALEVHQVSKFQEHYMGIYAVNGGQDDLHVHLKDGTYFNMMTQREVTVHQGTVNVRYTPLFLECHKEDIIS